MYLECTHSPIVTYIITFLFHLSKEIIKIVVCLFDALISGTNCINCKDFVLNSLFINEGYMLYYVTSLD